MKLNKKFQNIISKIKEKNQQLRSLKKKKDAKKKDSKIKKRFHAALRINLKKAGIDTDPQRITRNMFYGVMGFEIMITIIAAFLFSTIFRFGAFYAMFIIFLIWTLGFIINLFLFWLAYNAYLDIKIFYRRVAVENVLPDFLMLTASNIKSGMNIDKALWYAVRPKFGVLAKEIETVAKQTMSGEDLIEALEDFSERYDSTILKRSISLLTEGIKAGGEIGDLLNKIASNIQETKILKKEMAANVTTYVFFIAFASVIAAPVLFALSSQIINVVQTLSSSLDIPATAGVAGYGISFSASTITMKDFRIFAIASLIVTSFFSAIIVATIKKGSAKEGLKYIPLFILTSVSLYLIFSFVVEKAIRSFIII